MDENHAAHPNTMASPASPAPLLKQTKKKKRRQSDVEKTYQKKTQHEHVLLRPDTYVGSTQLVTDEMWVFDPPSGNIVRRTVTYCPALLKIFDEILVNAADNKQRDPTQDVIKVEIDQDANRISVMNNGNGIPVVKHREHDMYVPTMIFGHLLTGSNFDDEERKTTGGRNGYGAKLANIFSTKFTVETVDATAGKKFKQVFRNNMLSPAEPRISDVAGSAKEFTKVEFEPDLERFHMSRLDDDTYALLCRRVHDIAACSAMYSGRRLKVHLNGQRLQVPSFSAYIDLHDGLEAPVAFERIGDRWEVGVSFSDGQPRQLSYVNAIATTKGGHHVNAVVDQLVARLQKSLKKKNKGGDVKPHTIKQHLSVYVNCLIENPAFDSQTKETLVTRKANFGSTPTLSERLLKKVEKSEIATNILSYAAFKQQKELNRKGGAKRAKITGIPKLDDANFAGTAKSRDCTLILTEGDSAKALAVAGLAVVGRDYYGVFPLKGKPLNVRDAAHKQIMGNEEMSSLVRILGLKFSQEYTAESVRTLRYGHLMIMADQDHDGSHIKGLIINFVHFFWPSLLRVPGFLQQFITPIVKVRDKKGAEQSFFSLPAFAAWREALPDPEVAKWNIKYYKGLGTSTPKEAKEYFSDLMTHQLRFEALAPAEATGTPDGDLIDMAFRKARVEDRKAWILGADPDRYMEYDHGDVSYADFINLELVEFSKADCERSIPHLLDGLKVSQRKVLWACFRRGLLRDVKVAQLVGYISEASAYHHGETSLATTIVGLAQNFVGSNNVNLLVPSGQFGTRALGGKDAASPRYIFTRLEKVARLIFHPDDDALLPHQEDDGKPIEPTHYVPILPMVLVNGAEGIGTGWSSSVLQYNPRDIVDSLREKLAAGPEHTFPNLMPWYRGFQGTIEEKTGKTAGDATNFLVSGVLEEVSETELRISELPVGSWTQNYKNFLEASLVEKAASGFVQDFTENHTDTRVAFTVHLPAEKMTAIQKAPGGLRKKFKIDASASATNMHLYNREGRIEKYESVSHILQAFFEVRLELYYRRKAHLEERLGAEVDKLRNKARFIREVIAGDLKVANVARGTLLRQLESRDYTLIMKFGKDAGAGSDGATASSEEEGAGGEDVADVRRLANGYDYLLGMAIWQLTREKVARLEEQLAGKEGELDELRSTTPEALYLRDLDAVSLALEEMDSALAAENGAVPTRKRPANARTNTSRAARGKAAVSQARQQQKGVEDDSDESVELDLPSDDEGSDFEAKPPPKKSAGRPPATTDTQDAAAVSVKPAAKAAAAKVAPLKAKAAAARKGSKAVKVSKPARTTKAAPAAKRAPKKALASESEDSEEGDAYMDEASVSDASVEVEERVQPSRARRATKKTTYVVDLSSDSEAGEGGSDSGTSNAPEASVAALNESAASEATLNQSSVFDLENSESDFELKPMASPKPKAKAKAKLHARRALAPVSRTLALNDDSDEDAGSSGDDEDDAYDAVPIPTPTLPKPKGKALAKPKAKAAAKPKAKAKAAPKAKSKIKAASQKPKAKRAAAVKASPKKRKVVDQSDADSDSDAEPTSLADRLARKKTKTTTTPSWRNASDFEASGEDESDAEAGGAVNDRAPPRRAARPARAMVDSSEDEGSEYED